MIQMVLLSVGMYLAMGTYYLFEPASADAEGGGSVPPALQLLGLELPKGFARLDPIEQEEWRYGTMAEPEGWVFEQRLAMSDATGSSTGTGHANDSAAQVKTVFEHYRGQVLGALDDATELSRFRSPTLSYVDMASVKLSAGTRLKLMVFQARQSSRTATQNQPATTRKATGTANTTGSSDKVAAVPHVVVRLTLNRDPASKQKDEKSKGLLNIPGMPNIPGLSDLTGVGGLSQEDLDKVNIPGLDLSKLGK